MILNKIYESIGNTPIVKVSENLYLKVESFNPTGSVKDRLAYYLIQDGITKGLLKPNGTIIEPTSGNTGIALAALATVMGYKCIIVMPNNMSVERIKLIESYGAEVVLTPSEFGMQGSIDMARDMALEIENSYVPLQFDNKAGVTCHFKTTGPEIYNDLPDMNYFVCGIGTGGTITGVAKYLKMKTDVCVVGVEPKSSNVLSGGKKGPHKIQGIGAGFIPSILDLDLVDEIMAISNEEAIEKAKELALKYGISSGISGGACYAAMLKIANIHSDKKICGIIPDNALKYLSTELFK